MSPFSVRSIGFLLGTTLFSTFCLAATNCRTKALVEYSASEDVKSSRTQFRQSFKENGYTTTSWGEAGLIHLNTVYKKKFTYERYLISQSLHANAKGDEAATDESMFTVVDYVYVKETKSCKLIALETDVAVGSVESSIPDSVLETDHEADDSDGQ